MTWISGIEYRYFLSEAFYIYFNVLKFKNKVNKFYS